jgi:hypothetical protein
MTYLCVYCTEKLSTFSSVTFTIFLKGLSFGTTFGFETCIISPSLFIVIVRPCSLHSSGIILKFNVLKSFHSDSFHTYFQRNFSTILQIKLVSYIISQYDFSEKKFGPFYLTVETKTPFRMIVLYMMYGAHLFNLVKIATGVNS